MNINYKTNRRSFLKAGAFLMTAPIVASIDQKILSGSKIGLQLYTLRNEIRKDLEGTLKQAAAIGYKEVETFGYTDGKFFGKSPKDFKSMLDSLGLRAVSGHYGAGVERPDTKGTLSNDWQRAVDDAAELGQQYVNCAYLTPNERKSIEDYKKYVDLFNKAGEVASKAGIQFGYHNHDFEFQKLDGELGYDYIAGKTDPKLVKLELDLYWVVKAGLDPVELFEKYPGRFPLWHVKDMDKNDQSFAAVGTGSVDFKKIFNARKLSGMKHFFVEQDMTKEPVFEAITTSYSTLKKMRV